MTVRTRAPLVLSRMHTRYPSTTETVDELMERLGAPATQKWMFIRFYGLKESPVLAPGEEFEDLLVHAGRAALEHGEGAAENVRMVLYGHTLQAQRMDHYPGFDSRLAEGLGLPGVPVLGITQIGCTSVLRSITLAERFLDSLEGEAGQDASVLVLGGDLASLSDFARILPGVTVAGDSAVGFLVHRGPGRYSVVGRARRRDTRFYRNLGLDEDESRLYADVCQDKAFEVCQGALQDAGLALGDVDWLMPLLNNSRFWRFFCSTTGFPWERVRLDLLSEVGHCYGNDPLLALADADARGDLLPGQKCLLMTIGQGSYFEACVVEIDDE